MAELFGDVLATEKVGAIDVAAKNQLRDETEGRQEHVESRA